MTDQSQTGRGKGRRALLWTTAAILIVAGAGLAGYKYSLQNMITAQIEKQGGKAEMVSADFLGNIHLKNLSLPLKNGQIVNIASFEGRPEFLFLSGKAEASGISTEFHNFKITVPQLQIDNANFNRQMLQDLFGGSDLTPAQRIERFAAKKVHLSEVQVEQTILDNKQQTVYKNIILNDVKNGHIASMTLDKAELDMQMTIPQEDGSTTQEPLNILIGLTEGKDIDAAFMARFYTEKAAPEDNDIKQVQGAYSSKNIIIKLPEATATIDEIKSAGFSMRLPDFALLDMMQQMAQVENIDNMDDDERREFLRKLISIYEIFGKGDAEMFGIKITPDDETKASGMIASITMNFDKQSFDMSLKGMNIGNETDYFKMDEFAWSGFDYTATLAAGRKLLDVPDKEINQFPFTTMMPTIGTFQISGLDVDLPNIKADDTDNIEGEEADEAEAEAETASSIPARIKFKAKSASLAMLNPVNGIPTDIQINYHGLDIPVPQENDTLSRQLHDLGFERVILSSNTHLLWDEPSESLIIKDISYKGENLGSIAFSGVMGGMTRDFFSGDKAMMQIAALGLTAKEANLRIEDKGLINNAIKLAAQENGTTEEETRQIATVTIAMMAAELAKANPQIQDTVTALNKFLVNPNIFTLSIKSKNEKGIGAFEMLAASQNPMSLLDKVNISATAE